MNHISLFSGIGGFDLAAQWAGWNNIAQVEKDHFCLKVLNKNFPNVKKYEEVKEFDGTRYRGSIDVISGGFPCQPFSQAGQRRGTEDDRHLWPEFMRIIREVQPVWVVGENVHGFVSWSEGMAFEAAITDLENEGYETIPVVLPACGVGAPHKRGRIWILATNPRHHRGSEQTSKHEWAKKFIGGSQNELETGSNVAHAKSNHERRNGVCQEYQTGEIGGCSGKRNWRDQWKTKSAMGRMVNGIPSGMDGRVIWESEPDIPRTVKSMENRANRLKGLGNAIVPQVAYQIFSVINEMQ